MPPSKRSRGGGALVGSDGLAVAAPTPFVRSSKRARAADANPSDEEEDEEDDAEAAADAAASGLFAPRAARGPAAFVNNRDALRAAFRGIAQDLPWIERLEVVSADALAIADMGDDLKVELTLCVRRAREGGSSTLRRTTSPSWLTCSTSPRWSGSAAQALKRRRTLC